MAVDAMRSQERRDLLVEVRRGGRNRQQGEDGEEALHAAIVHAEAARGNGESLSHFPVHMIGELVQRAGASHDLFISGSVWCSHRFGESPKNKSRGNVAEGRVVRLFISPAYTSDSVTSS